MKKNNGFTLVEIIAAVIIIGILAIIIVPSVTGYLSNSRKESYRAHELSMEEAAKEMTIEVINGSDKFSLPKRGGSEDVFLSDLIDKEFIDSLKDPQTGKECDADMSYVRIIRSNDDDYDYEACLYCGAYVSDNPNCEEVSVTDDTDPICGTVTGESSEWTNNSRTMTVGCSDPESGCKRSKFSKTFNTTSDEDGKDIITIENRAGKTSACEVYPRVDKEKPTCELRIVDGGEEESTGWISGRSATIEFVPNSIKDKHSGVLTYGIGTSIKNPSYNKKTSYEVNNISGTITVVGYVKDNAGNEGICYKTITTGLERPKFDIRYGYQIYPLKERFDTSDVEILSDTKLRTKSTTPTITFNHMNKYTGVTSVVMNFKDNVYDATVFKLTVDGKTYSGSAETSKRIRFYIEKEPELNRVTSSSTYTIQLSDLANQEYDIDRIEIQQVQGNLMSKYPVDVNLITRKQVVKTSKWSWNNGIEGSWENQYYKSFSTSSGNTSGIAKVKNDIPLVSDGVNYSIVAGDTTPPTVSITSSNTNWTNQNITLTAKAKDTGTGIIAYAWSTSNTIDFYTGDWTYYDSPNTTELSYNYTAKTNGTYYFYAKDDAGNVEKKSITVTNIDKLVPTCSAITGNGNQAVLSCSDPVATTDYGQSKLIKIYFGTKSNPDVSEFETIIEGYAYSTNKTVNSGSKYYVFAIDKAGNRSVAVSEDYYTITFNGNGATTAGTASGIIRYKAKSISTITNPVREYTVSFDKNGTNATATTTSKKATYILNGWYTAATNGSKVASSSTTPALQASVSGYTNSSKEWTKTSGATLYAQWTAAAVTLPKISKTGNDCKWNTKADGTGTNYSGESSYTPSDDVTLYAICVPNLVTINFDANGGKASESSRQYTPNAAYGSLPTADMCDSDFQGWYTSATGGTKVKVTDIVSGTPLEQTLYAHYVKGNYLYSVLKCNYNVSGSGIRKYSSDHKDSPTGSGTDDIYYWYNTNALEKRNVRIGNMCFVIIRTTDTGGVKIMFNGFAENNKCLDDRTSGFGYYDYAYKKTISSDNYYYATDYSFDQSTKKFKLSGSFTRAVWSSSTSNNLIGKYTCLSTDKNATCDYLYLMDGYLSDTKFYAITLSTTSRYDTFGYLSFVKPRARSEEDLRELVKDHPLKNQDLSISAHRGISLSDVGYMHGDYEYLAITVNPISSANTIATSKNITAGTTIYYGTGMTSIQQGSGSSKYYNYKLVNQNTYTWSGTDNSSMVGKYICLSYSYNTCYSGSYVVGVDGTTVIYQPLSVSNPVAKPNVKFSTNAIDNGNGTYTLDSGGLISISSINWFNDFDTKYKNKNFYICSDYISTTCSKDKMYYITSWSKTSSSGISYIPMKHKYLYSNNFTYDGTNYRLTNATAVFETSKNNLINKRYTCFNESGVCKKIYYVFYAPYSAGTIYVYELENGIDITQMVNRMLYNSNINKYDSLMKKGVDLWYQKYLNSYSSLFEDVIYCNDRTRKADTDSTYAFNKDGNAFSGTTFMEFNASGLLCKSETDSFSLSNPKAKLKYPVGLITYPENNLMYVQSLTGKSQFTMTPRSYMEDGTLIWTSHWTGVMDTGRATTNYYVRPVVSLKKGTKITGGDGSTSNPFTVN